MNVVKEEVFGLFKEHFGKEYMFHNYTFTLYALEALDTIADKENIANKEDLTLARIAICFHVTGYAKDGVTGGVSSIQFAKDYLKNQHFETTQVDIIVNLIAVATNKANPETILEKLVHDASLFYLADKNFNEYQQLWRAEHEALTEELLRDDTWLAILKKHTDSVAFSTSYAIKNWSYKATSDYLKLVERGKKSAQKQVEKGKDTVFRITLRNHISLSDNADRKAHILLSVNAIIISITFSRIFPKLDNPSNAFLYVPTLVFVTFTVISIILSVIATRPRVTKGHFSYEELTSKKVNILFFGNFYKVPLAEYERAMDKLLSSDEYIYNSLTKDLYYLGKVVAKKYMILQYTYIVFMIGIVLSTLLYVIYFNMYYN